MEKTIEQQILERLVRLETKLDNYNGLKEIVYETNNKAVQNERNLGEIRDSIKWLTRTVTGAVVTTVVGLIFTLIRLGG